MPATQGVSIGLVDWEEEKKMREMEAWVYIFPHRVVITEPEAIYRINSTASEVFKLYSLARGIWHIQKYVPSSILNKWLGRWWLSRGVNINRGEVRLQTDAEDRMKEMKKWTTKLRKIGIIAHKLQL